MEQELEDTIFFTTHKDKYGQSSIWVLVNEKSQYFNPYLKEHPWALFKLATHSQLLIEVQKPVQAKLTDLESRLAQSKQTYKALVVSDQQLNTR